VKDIALQLTRETAGQKLHILREYLQNYILSLMQKLGMSSSIYFVGGTALRFISDQTVFRRPGFFSRGKLEGFGFIDLHEKDRQST